MGFTQVPDSVSLEQDQHPYVYVLVRRDLSNPQRIVQSGHALIEATRAYAPTQGVHPSVIVCGIRNENRLKKAMTKLDEAGIKYCAFQEPDRNNEFTAIATEPITGDRRSFFSQFHLLGEEESTSAPTKQGVDS